MYFKKVFNASIEEEKNWHDKVSKLWGFFFGSMQEVYYMIIYKVSRKISKFSLIHAFHKTKV